MGPPPTPSVPADLRGIMEKAEGLLGEITLKEEGGLEDDVEEEEERMKVMIIVQSFFDDGREKSLGDLVKEQLGRCISRPSLSIRIQSLEERRRNFITHPSIHPSILTKPLLHVLY